MPLEINLSPDLYLIVNGNEYAAVADMREEKLLKALYNALMTGAIPGKHGDVYLVGGEEIAACVEDIHVYSIDDAYIHGFPYSRSGYETAHVFETQAGNYMATVEYSNGTSGWSFCMLDDKARTPFGMYATLDECITCAQIHAREFMSALSACCIKCWIMGNAHACDCE